VPTYDYAAGWLDEQAVKLETGKLKVSTYEKYQAVLARYALKQFGDKAVVSITPRDCERFRADLVERLSRKSVRDAWQPFRAVLRYAQRHNAIPANLPTQSTSAACTRWAMTPRRRAGH